MSNEDIELDHLGGAWVSQVELYYKTWVLTPKWPELNVKLK